MSSPLPAGATCDHENMVECCEGCGHFFCEDCGLSWDDWGEGGYAGDDEPPWEDPEEEG